MFNLASQKVSRRLDQGIDRPDFFTHILKNQESGKNALTKDEMDSNALLLLNAGSETTATTLSGTTWLLLKDPMRLAKATNEVRSTFKSQKEITMDSVAGLPYMIACLQEGLRYYPPVPTGFPRIVPPGGDTISAYYIPEGTLVYVSQHAANHSPRNYTDPDSFIPERWLGHERYKNDRFAVTQPFSFGPRNCVGKNLAYAEMRVILAKMLFNFDMELLDKATDWIGVQKVFLIWQKGPLLVRLRPVQQNE